MDTVIVQLTGGNIRNGHIYIKELLRRGWFGSEVIGASNRNDGIGRLVRLDVAGLPEPIESDIPSRPGAPGEPREFFRERSWVQSFITHHGLKAEDMVVFERLGPYHLRIRPAKAARAD